MKFPKITLHRAKTAAEWFESQFGLEDWTFRLWVQDEVPDWVVYTDDLIGFCRWFRDIKLAKVWVSQRRANEEPHGGFAILFHEMAHVLLEDVNLETANNLPVEGVLSGIGHVSALAYQARKVKRK